MVPRVSMEYLDERKLACKRSTDPKAVFLSRKNIVKEKEEKTITRKIYGMDEERMFNEQM